eukprot:6198825-Pleurochrysis_carterae.AAC.1
MMSFIRARFERRCGENESVTRGCAWARGCERERVSGCARLQRLCEEREHFVVVPGVGDAQQRTREPECEPAVELWTHGHLGGRLKRAHALPAEARGRSERVRQQRELCGDVGPLAEQRAGRERRAVARVPVQRHGERQPVGADGVAERRRVKKSKHAPPADLGQVVHRVDKRVEVPRGQCLRGTCRQLGGYGVEQGRWLGGGALAEAHWQACVLVCVGACG